MAGLFGTTILKYVLRHKADLLRFHCFPSCFNRFFMIAAARDKIVRLGVGSALAVDTILIKKYYASYVTLSCFLFRDIRLSIFRLFSNKKEDRERSIS